MGLGGLSDIASAYGNERAGKKQRQAEANAAALELLMNKKAADVALKELEPWRDMENQSRSSMMDILGYNGEEAKQRALESLMNSPAVQMRLRTGTSALDRSAAGKGGLFSGNQAKALAKYGQDLGSQEFWNEYNRRAGMMDWAYGNAGNRATIERGRYTGAGQIMGSSTRRLGELDAQAWRDRGNYWSNAEENLWGKAKDAVGMVTSLYGGGKGIAAGGRNPYA